jgi:hypothetical protein
MRSLKSQASGNGASAKASRQLGQLASGSAGNWTLSIEQTLRGAERWFANLESRTVQLFFELKDLSVIDSLVAFLSKRCAKGNWARRPARHTADMLTLGSVGRADVALVGDDEHLNRCFLVVGPPSTASVRLTLLGDDMSALLAACRQVQEDLA